MASVPFVEVVGTSMGWAAKLHCYLMELPDNVSKDMDVVSWWLVSLFIFVSL